MKLISDVGINFIPPGITHYDKIYLIGSCFTEHIANKLQEGGFDVHCNSHGIIYNPISIRKCLEDLLDKREYDPNDLFFHQGLWHSFHHHGSFSGTDPETVCQRINETIKEHREFLLKAKHVFITPGTSWLYRKKSSIQVVANCHKVPSYDFEKVLMDAEEETNHWLKLLQRIQSFLRELTIYFTISPVKHLKDGFFENNLSKGLLHQLIYNIMQQNKSIRYFPSFEIMQDELRDYRFYDWDLAHPNALAIDIIWEKFKLAYFAKPTQEIIDEVMEIGKLNQHKIFHVTEESKKFESYRIKRMQDLQKKYPFIKIVSK